MLEYCCAGGWRWPTWARIAFADLAAFVAQIRPAALVLVGDARRIRPLLEDWPQWIKQISSRPLVALRAAFVLQPELQNRCRLVSR